MSTGLRIVLILTLIALSGALARGDRLRESGNHPGAELEQQLQQRGVEIDTPSVIEAAESHDDEAVRWMAAELLGRRGEHGAEGVLRKILLNDQSRLMRETAALALARLGDKEALADVEEFAATADEPSRRLYLAGQLAEFGVFDSYPYVVDAATSEQEYLRIMSAGVLVRFVTRGFAQSEGRSVPQELLLKLLEDPSAKVRSYAVLELFVGSGRGLDLEPYLLKIEHLAEDDSDLEVRERARLQLNYWTESNKAGEP